MQTIQNNLKKKMQNFSTFTKDTKKNSGGGRGLTGNKKKNYQGGGGFRGLTVRQLLCGSMSGAASSPGTLRL